MRLNKFVALAAGVSRRQADELIEAGQIMVNGMVGRLGQPVADNDEVTNQGQPLKLAALAYLLLHKPAGFVCSRQGQGAPTIYELLPKRYENLQSVGRLDKDTSGLLLLANDGDWAQELTHPRHGKTKVYEVELNQPLPNESKARIEAGIKLDDGLSQFDFISTNGPAKHTIRLKTGKNRQIRRTFAAVELEVVKLHRTEFGPYQLGTLKSGQFKEIEKS